MYDTTKLVYQVMSSHPKYN